MAKKKDIFDEFMERNTGSTSRVVIASPHAAAGEGAVKPAAGSPSGAEAPRGAATAEPVRRPGRPRVTEGKRVNMNFLIDPALKRRLEELKLKLYRGTVTELITEAIYDLIKKYED